jgi:hypothetical protein
MRTCEVDGVKVFVGEPMRIDYGWGKTYWDLSTSHQSRITSLEGEA